MNYIQLIAHYLTGADGAGCGQCYLSADIDPLNRRPGRQARAKPTTQQKRRSRKRRH